MAGLDFCSKHNMVAYLEKNDGNTKFHQIMDFLIRSSIHFTLTVSPIVSTLFVEQFWTSAKSRIVNNISYIDAFVAGKPVTILEASIRSDLLFDDADGIDTLNNQAIFDTIQLMRYKGDLNTLTFNKALFSPQWKFLFHTMNHCISSKSTSWDQIPTNIATALKDVPVPKDHFLVPTLTKKVLTFMVKKGKNFLGNVTPLFYSMLVQPTKDEGEVSERPSESQPIPSLTHPSEDQPEPQPYPFPKPSPSIPIPDSNPEGSGGNHEGQSSSDRSLSGNEDGLTLQSVYDICISLCTQVTYQVVKIITLKAQIKQLKKKARPVINHHKAWFRAARLKKQHKLKDMEKTKKRRSVSKQGRKAVKSSKGAPFVHTHIDWDSMDTDLEDYTLTQDEGTDKQSTDLQQSIDLQQSTAEVKDQILGEIDTPIVPTMTSIPTPTVFGDDETITQVLVTMSQNKLKQKEKEKGVELKDVEDIERPRPTSTRSLLTLKPLPKIDPKAKGKGKIKEEDESDTESEDINEAENKFKMLANDEEMARKVQEEWEAEEEKKRLAEEEATKAALTNKYEFIQARLNADKILAEKLQEEEREKFTIEERAKFLHDTIAAQRRFLAQQRSEVIRNKLPSRTQLRNQMMTYLKHVGGKKHSDLKTKFFEEIQVLYEKVKRSDENFIAIGSVEDEMLIKDLNKKAASIKKDDSIKEESKEEEEAPDEDKEVDYEILDKKYQDEIPEGFDRVLWGDLMIMFNPSDEDEFWNSQHDWNVVSWKLHGSSGVHTLMTEAGLVIHMLVEKKYPLRKKVLLQMLELKLESEEDSFMALELIRFVKKLVAELEPEDSDGNEEDL
ncbi:hypothetical protein Tco_1018071 [Tanacetum coccineum]|uniref:Uncharacterized protein n=1 Tax=Tanacetum coccineum TaxID=301880 RepID=A0ABQ5FTA7_9ASTR